MGFCGCEAAGDGVDEGEGDGAAAGALASGACVCDWVRTGVDGPLWAGVLMGEPGVQKELGFCMVVEVCV